MAELFVYDNNYPKLTESEITILVNSIAPKRADTQINTGKGFIFKFHQDVDVNFIFTPYAISFFTTNKVAVSLSLHTQRQRHIYIPNPPIDYLGINEQEYISDIRKRYALNILSFKQFRSTKTGKYYFVLTPTDNTVTKQITDTGFIVIFNHVFTVQAKLGAQSGIGAVGSSLPHSVHQTMNHRPGQTKTHNTFNTPGPALSAQ